MNIWKQKFERLPEDNGDKAARWIVIGIIAVLAIAKISYEVALHFKWINE